MKHLLGKDVFILGARWHYRGILVRVTKKHFYLDQCQMVFSHNECQIQSSQSMGDNVPINADHVSAVTLTAAFLENEEPLEDSYFLDKWLQRNERKKFEEYKRQKGIRMVNRTDLIKGSIVSVAVLTAGLVAGMGAMWAWL